MGLNLVSVRFREPVKLDGKVSTQVLARDPSISAVTLEAGVVTIKRHKETIMVPLSNVAYMHAEEPHVPAPAPLPPPPIEVPPPPAPAPPAAHKAVKHPVAKL